MITMVKGQQLLSNSVSSALQQQLDNAVNDNDGYGGGILRMQYANGTVLWQGASGQRVAAGGSDTATSTSSNINASDSFEVASVTKALTSTVILQLIEEGKINLDAPITQYTFPPHVMDNAQGTVRQVLQHYSGMPDYWTDPPFIGNKANEENAFLTAFNANATRIWQHTEMPAYANNLTTIAVPGKEFHYADTGYVLFGLIIQNITGVTLEQAFEQRIFKPLGMSHTFLRDWQPSAPAIPNFAHRYEDDLDISVLPRQSADWAGGGLVSNAQDMATFIFALAAGKLFKNPGTLEVMKTWLPTDEDDVYYGLGLYRVDLDEDGEIWGHDGHCNSFMYYWPQKNITFTGTLNQDDADWYPLFEKDMEYVP